MLSTRGMDANRADPIVGVNGVGNSDLVEAGAGNPVDCLIQECLDFTSLRAHVDNALDKGEDAQRGALSRFDVKIGGLTRAPAFEESEDALGLHHSTTPASKPRIVSIRGRSTNGSSAAK